MDISKTCPLFYFTLGFSPFNQILWTISCQQSFTFPAIFTCSNNRKPLSNLILANKIAIE
jgi:hypothetical protein